MCSVCLVLSPGQSVSADFNLWVNSLDDIFGVNFAEYRYLKTVVKNCECIPSYSNPILQSIIFNMYPSCTCIFLNI